jgi:membrane fusion protein, heavy metal efflux system
LGGAVEPDQEPLLEIGDTDAIWIIAEVFESDLKYIQKGDSATIEVATLQGETLKGSVVALGAEFSDEQRRVPVYIELAQPHRNLRSGMYAKVTLFPRAENHLILPSAAVLIKDGKRTVVYVETEDGVFQEREVSVGPSHKGMISILEGLSPIDSAFRSFKRHI